LPEEPADHRLRLLVVPLPDVAVPDDAPLVDEHQRRPRADRIALPHGEFVVLDDRIRDLEVADGVHDLVERLFPPELGTVYADDREGLRGVFGVPIPQLRDHILAVVSAEGPEFDRDDTPAQIVDLQRLAVDPPPGGDLGRRPPRRGLGFDAGGHRQRDHRSGHEQPDAKGPMLAHAIPPYEMYADSRTAVPSRPRGRVAGTPPPVSPCIPRRTAGAPAGRRLYTRASP